MANSEVGAAALPFSSSSRSRSVHWRRLPQVATALAVEVEVMAAVEVEVEMTVEVAVMVVVEVKAAVNLQKATHAPQRPCPPPSKAAVPPPSRRQRDFWTRPQLEPEAQCRLAQRLFLRLPAAAKETAARAALLYPCAYPRAGPHRCPTPRPRLTTLHPHRGP